MEKNKEQIVKIQHYIPRCVLKNFADKNDQVYEGLVMDKTNISNSMAERFTYEHSLIEINTLENFFNRIENYIGPAHTRIISAIDIYDGNFR